MAGAWRGTTGTIRALAWATKKEWLLFVRYPVWLVILVALPLMLAAQFLFQARAFSLGQARPLVEVTEGVAVDYAGYAVVGMVALMWFALTLQDMGMVVRREQAQGTLESNWLAPSPRWLLLAGKAALLAAVMGLSAAVVFVEARLVFGVPFAVHPVSAGLALGLGGLVLVGMGVCAAGLVTWIKEAEPQIQIVQALGVMLSGMIFPVAALPAPFQVAARAFPLTWVLDAVRGAFLLGLPPRALATELTVLAGLGAGLLVAGGLLFRTGQRWGRRTGTLHTH